MISRTIAAALLTTALLTGVASAQPAAANKDAAGATMHREGEWRASKLAGVNVYNEANEKIGDINDVILDKSGKASKVILGVGGFLGMGEHLVAVPLEKLKWVNEPARSAGTSTAPTNVDGNARTASDGTARTTTGTATTTAAARAGHNWYPDHAVYNATKDQLKAMPEFKY
ncbi:PRC-barrel domain-containing protein [Bradyrhizobium sp.]|uniref:PRC-barrel domain-containing protein n=1 Tax=Bradyrhizobium sp. TaxID=376 RepID=UPI002DFE932B|nr:PRC-barrel domain-containing protein [Bradyrhizobium sp.]